MIRSETSAQVNNDLYQKKYREILYRIRYEIKLLQTEVSYLRPKAEAYDVLCTVLGFLPKQTQGMSEDILCSINKEIDKLEAQDTASTT